MTPFSKRDGGYVLILLSLTLAALFITFEIAFFGVEVATESRPHDSSL